MLTRRKRTKMILPNPTFLSLSSTTSFSTTIRRPKPSPWATQKITRKLYTLWDDEVEGSIKDSLLAGREINPHFVALPKDLSEVHSLWLEVALSGIVVWKRGCEIDNQPQKIRLPIATGRFQRKVTHAQPYWIRSEEELTI